MNSLNHWSNDLSKQKNSPKHLLIAGPCSAESPEQLLNVAKVLKDDGRVHYLRAGVWKPRTLPGKFQGYGEDALKWLSYVKKETGMPIATEVANQEHVNLALKYGVDLLWVGARTVGNPFSVQEIADALRGTQVPVLVKNPLSPEIDLWEGAINRLAKAGINNLGAIHRGFPWWKKNLYRNQPLWDVPLELKRRMPEIPVINDPSHIAGKQSLVEMVAQRALLNQLDGLMVEVHPTPETALSDAQQQLTPDQFLFMLDNLVCEQDGSDKPALLLTELRNEIDSMDELLLWIIANRMELAGQIAGIKNSNSLPVLQQDRWNQVLTRAVKLGEDKGLRQNFIEQLFNCIHEESCKTQSAHIGNKASYSEKQANFAY